MTKLRSCGISKKKEHEKLEKYQGLKEDLKKMWRMNAAVVPVAIGELWTMTPELGTEN